MKLFSVPEEPLSGVWKFSAIGHESLTMVAFSNKAPINAALVTNVVQFFSIK